MLKLFRNRPVRRYFSILTVLFLLSITIGICIMRAETEETVRNLVQKDLALIGGMKLGKEVEDLSLMTGIIEENDLAAGRAVMKPYSYERADPELYGYYDTLLRRRALTFVIWAFAAYLLSAAVLLCAFYTVFQGIRSLTAAAQSAVKGEAVPIEPGGEGDEAAMRYAFTAMADRVRHSMTTLQEDQRYLKNFLSDVSHQLKTPLAAVRMYLEILERPELEEATRNDFLRRSREQVERTEWLVQGLLKMARVESGAVEMELCPHYLIDTVQSAAEPLRGTAEQKGILLQCNVPGEILFRHDAQWVAEALGNLVKNAVEHTPAGGRVAISAEETPMTVVLIVEDNGEGMESTEIPHIFERFYRSASHPNPGSVGIGLSLAKQILEQNGADIYVQSKKGQGSRFVVTFLKMKKS
jgi:signal transduction histidine kinase